jgi:predicted TIM-barrel fold metal-dependent hydrolase
MLIVDAHTHIGVERLFNLVMSADELLGLMERFNIDKALVQPQAGAPDIVENHNEIFALTEKHPKKIYGLASFNPVTSAEAYYDKAVWAVRELGFRGLKLHTNGFSISPLNPFARNVFETARALKTPVMVHTGAGVPQALPSLVIPVAREFHDIPIVLAHAGGGLFASEAVIAAQLCENIYLETSWVYPADVQAMISAVGAERVMFGSDIFQNIPSHLAIYEHLGLSDKEYEQVIGLTAVSLFDLN